MKALAVVLGSLLLTACATLPGDPSKMTAEQIREAVKDKTASIGCGATQTPYKINMLLVVLDKLSLPPGYTLRVEADCTVTITGGAQEKL